MQFKSMFFAFLCLAPFSFMAMELDDIKEGKQEEVPYRNRESNQPKKLKTLAARAVASSSHLDLSKEEVKRLSPVLAQEKIKEHPLFPWLLGQLQQDAMQHFKPAELPTFTMKHSAQITKSATSKDQSLVAVGGTDNKITIFKVGNPNPMLHIDTNHNGTLQHIEFDPLNRFIVTNSDSDPGIIKIWNLDNPNVPEMICCSEPIVRFIIDSSGKRIAIKVESNLVYVYDIQTKSKVKTIILEANNFIKKIAFFDYDNLIVLGSFNLSLISLNANQEKKLLTNSLIKDFIFDEQNQLIIAYNDYQILGIDLARDVIWKQENNSSISEIFTSKDELIVLPEHDFGNITIYDSKTGRLKKSVLVNENSLALRSWAKKMAVSTDTLTRNFARNVLIGCCSHMGSILINLDIPYFNIFSIVTVSGLMALKPRFEVYVYAFKEISKDVYKRGLSAANRLKARLKGENLSQFNNSEQIIFGGLIGQFDLFFFDLLTNQFNTVEFHESVIPETQIIARYLFASPEHFYFTFVTQNNPDTVTVMDFKPMIDLLHEVDQYLLSNITLEHLELFNHIAPAIEQEAMQEFLKQPKKIIPVLLSKQDDKIFKTLPEGIQKVLLPYVRIPSIDPRFMPDYVQPKNCVIQ